MSKLYVAVRERKDRPGKWIVDVRRGAERHPRTFDSYPEARDFAKAVERAERNGELTRTPEVPRIRTLAQMCQAYLEEKEGAERSKETINTYRYLLERGALPRLGSNRDLVEVTEEHIRAFLRERRKEVSARTVRSEYDRLKALWDFAVHRGVARSNVVAQVVAPKVPKKVYDWLRSDELGPFLDKCSIDFAPIARFTVFTGFRRREVVFLQRGDVDLANGVIQIRVKPHLGFTPKNGKERSVPIDPVLRPILEQHLQEKVKPEPGAFVFPQRGGARRSATTRWFAEATGATAARAGVGRDLTFHDLRRTYGAMCIEAGMDLLTVSKLLGHSDIKITQEVYAPICGRYLAQEASKLGRHLGKHLLRAARPPSAGVV